MSVLVIGGDDIFAIKGVLYGLGAKEVNHWDGEKNDALSAKAIPSHTDYILMMTDFINQKMVDQYKKMAHKEGIPLVCTRRSVSCVYGEFCKVLGKDFGCPFN
ncbi:MAG: DUF2325 domain-containing protein [Epsilonproteobacteria bacterium]|nr:DUF2325 domain-containing protein [Campylobacterota bacterium]